MANKGSNKTKVMGNVIKLPKVRLSFPDLFVPRAFEDGQEPKYGCNLLLDPKNPDQKSRLLEVKDEQNRLIAAAWPSGKPPKLVLEFWGKGETRVSNQTGEVYDGYAGMYFIAAKAAKPPLVMDKHKNHLANGDPRVYGGVYCNATINLWVQDNKWGKAIRCGLRGIQVLGYGEAFGNQVSDEEFDDFDVGDDEFGDDDIDF